MKTAFSPHSLLFLAAGVCGNLALGQTRIDLDFDYAFFLPSDVTSAPGGDFSSQIDFVDSVSSGLEMGRMPLWDYEDVGWIAREIDGQGDFNSIVSAIDWNSSASVVNPIDGNGTGSTIPNYYGIPVNNFWRGLGIQLVTGNTLSLLDSHDYFLNDGVAGDVGNIRGGLGGPGGDGDNDNLTGNDPDVDAAKESSTSSGNTAPTALAMGNVLVNEENAGDGIPDDAGNGGAIRFEIDDENAYRGISVQAQLANFAFVDDTKGEIKLVFEMGDPTSDADNFTLTSQNLTSTNGVGLPALGYAGTQNNQVFFIDIEAALLAYDADNSTNLSNAYLDYWEIDYNSSGGLGEVEFKFINTAPPPTPLPEASTVIGALSLVGLLGLGRLRALLAVRQSRKTSEK